MLKEILTGKMRTKTTERKIEINPYITDAGARRGDSNGIVDTILSFVPFRKKKEEPRVNPFLTPKPLQAAEEQVVPEPEPVQKERGWIWYIPVVIAEQIEWLKSHTSAGRKMLEKRSEENARYEHFMSLFDKKD